jgi:ferric-dicitrate binding protein FerR (iron transport regulator)
MRSDRRKTPTTSPQDARSPRRRNFLLAVGVGGAGAAALAARVATGIAPQSDAADATDAKGYQVTDHVRRYYRTAKI